MCSGIVLKWLRVLTWPDVLQPLTDTLNGQASVDKSCMLQDENVLAYLLIQQLFFVTRRLK